MRLANVHDRATLIVGSLRGIDIAEASNGQYGPALGDVYQNWEAFLTWEADFDRTSLNGQIFDFTPADLRAPSPSPRQIIAIGLNYRAHAAESGFEVPENLPPTFTKFVSCLTGPEAEVDLPQGGNTDWEVELVVVIGRETSNVSAADVWSRIAGLTVGQDLSERVSQLAGPAPQFSLGKSFPQFGPTGPWLVTPDDFENPDNLELSCSVNGETVQLGRTKDLIFNVPELISRLSQTITLYPGDIVFSGTPDGVGLAMKPARFLRPGDELVSWIEGIGSIRQTFRSA